MFFCLKRWVFGDNMCTYYGFVAMIFGFVMMTSIAMIAIDEYLLYDWAPYSKLYFICDIIILNLLICVCV